MTDNTTTTAASADESNHPQPQAASQLIPNLLDDISLHCLARIPRSFHLNISLVSKSWHSAVNSTALFTTRSLLNTTETSLYLNLRIDSGFHWYRLLPNCSPSQKKPSKRYLVHLPPIPSQGQTLGTAFSVVGPKIYVIGGFFNGIPSNCMWIFDCRFSRWERGPKMLVGREFAVAGVVGGKIYVMGGCVVDNRSLNWAEVFDPVMGSWAPVPCPIEGREDWMVASAVIGDRVYAVGDRGGVVYDVGVGKWGNVSKRLDFGWISEATAVLGGVLYCRDSLGKIRGYDVKDDSWKELKGVETGLPRFLCGATMVNLDGRLCVVWEAKGRGKDLEIMYAEIEIWKEGDGSLNGKILWSDVLLVVPKRAAVVNCLAAEF